MANARIVFNSDGFKQLFNSSEVEALVLSEAQKIADAASEGLEGEGTVTDKQCSQKVESKLNYPPSPPNCPINKVCNS